MLSPQGVFLRLDYIRNLSLQLHTMLRIDNIHTCGVILDEGIQTYLYSLSKLKSGSNQAFMHVWATFCFVFLIGGKV